MIFLWTALSGWTATLLLATGIAIPYVIRTVPSSALAGIKLTAHYCCAPLIVTAAFIHALIPMSWGHARAYNANGLLLATIALCAMFWQIAHGLLVRASHGAARQTARRAHFVTMLGIGSLVAAHIVLNRA
jgi:hypothetical protein